MPEKMFHVEQVEPGTPEWLETRRKYVCGSDVPAILGMSRFNTAYDVCLSKWGEKPPEKPVDGYNPALRGRALEPVLCQAYAMKFQAELSPEFFAVHPSNEWMASTPDAGIVGEKKHVQLKTHVPWLADEYGETGTDAVPENEYLQVTHEIAVTGNESADLTALFAPEPVFQMLVFMVQNLATQEALKPIARYILDNMDFRTFTLQRRAELESEMIEAERAFWYDYVVPHKLPPTAPVLKDSGMIRAASEEEQATILGLRTAYVNQKKAAQFFDDMKARCQTLIGGDTGIDAPSIGKITFKRTAAGGVSYKEVAAVLKDMLDMGDLEYKRIVEANQGPGYRKFNYPYRRWGKEI